VWACGFVFRVGAVCVFGRIECVAVCVGAVCVGSGCICYCCLYGCGDFGFCFCKPRLLCVLFCAVNGDGRGLLCWFRDARTVMVRWL